MERPRLIPALLLPLLAACGRQEPEVDWYARLAAARGLAPEPPATPAQHYFLQAHTAFPADGIGERVQSSEVLLGGPAHLKYVIKAGVLTQIFLVQGPDLAWQRGPRADHFAAYDAARLAKETWVRWLVARFPWDWKDALAQARPTAYTGGERDFHLTGPYGDCVLGVDAALQPFQVKLPDLVLDLEGNAAAPGQPRFPKEWYWKHAGQEWHETVDAVSAGVTAFDEVFAPPEQALPGGARFGAALAEPGGRLDSGGDSIGLIQSPDARFLVGPWPADWARPLQEQGVLEGTVWRLQDGGEGRAAVALAGAAPEPLPAGVELRAEPAGRFLRWSTRRRISLEDGVAALRAAAAQSKLRTPGPVYAFLADPALGGRSEWLVRLEGGP